MSKTNMQDYADSSHIYINFVNDLSKLCGNEIILDTDKKTVVKLLRMKFSIIQESLKLNDELQRLNYIIDNFLSMLVTQKYHLKQDGYEMEITDIEDP